MKKMTLALAAAGAIAGSAIFVPSIAVAQARPAAAAERQYKLSKAEQAAIGPLMAANLAADTARKAGQSPDWGQVRALLPAAKAAAKGDDARYLIARIELSLALGANDTAAQERALTTLLASKSTT